MIHRSVLVLSGAALLAALAFPDSLAAQSEVRGAAAAQDSAAPAAGARVVPTGLTPGQDADYGSEKRTSRQEVMQSMRDGEIKHRERLATIHRLRAIAESQGQAERMALLDKLEVKEDSAYQNRAQLAANRLGNTSAYKQSLMKLSAGRIRKNVPAEPTLSEAEQAEAAAKKAKRQGARQAKTEAKQAEAQAELKAEKTERKAEKSDETKADAPKAERKLPTKTTLRTGQRKHTNGSTPSSRSSSSSTRRSGGSGSSSGGRSPRGNS